MVSRRRASGHRSPKSPPASGRSCRPCAHRRTSGRGGVYLDDVRAVEAPTPVIAKINVLKDGDLGLGEADRMRLRRYVAFATKHILGSTKPFCSHEDDNQRRAVAYLEEREPRLAVCVSSWGACALLSRGLQHRRPRS
ncbi:hypothetical protein BU14_0490s0015 [Porphyra umbilicalis]|uniref:Uncharacterized protein n=1 Tax=Porphyra umbilicalis TaxID=2786 RepID=A0A1X6NTL8_PORUM|nr:hypothetical protein BU14_0490s0015 [Porphyra umbilicalis]|eukprot:OSX71917.1 hypothetical protein BU14_0490s0015 [Porphyra umbilicalis]